MSITEERDQLIDFTQPYFPPEPSVFVALAGAGDATAGGRVAVQTATVQADYLDGKVASLLEYPLAEDTVAAVERRGRCDLRVNFLSPGYCSREPRQARLFGG